jgi:hypothetical protein
MKRIFLFALALFCFTAPAFSGDGVWTADITPYLWMAGQNGDAVVLGQPTEIDISFSDVIDNFDMGLAGHLEANKDRWTLLFDFQYVNVSDKPNTVEIRVKNTVLEGGTAYRLHPAFEALGGVRIVNYKLELTPEILDPIERSKTWVDPFVGGRAKAKVSDNFTVIGRFDIGGFSVGSDFSWNLILGASYDWERISLLFGYRAWNVDYDSGEALRELKLDLTTSGPFVGITFHI